MQWIFSFLWLGVLGSALTLPFALHGENIGPTKFCFYSFLEPYDASAWMVASTVFDTVVFLTISWKLSIDQMTGTIFRDKVKQFFGGRTLPTLSRGLLQSGQLYYL